MDGADLYMYIYVIPFISMISWSMINGIVDDYNSLFGYYKGDTMDGAPPVISWFVIPLAN